MEVWRIPKRPAKNNMLKRQAMRGNMLNDFFRMADELNKTSVKKPNAMNVEAATCEHFENSVLYPEFADVAEKEGHKEIAVGIRAKYKELLENVEQGGVFKKNQKVYCTCRNCGYVHEGTEPPAEFLSCGHPKSYFQVVVEEYRSFTKGVSTD